MHLFANHNSAVERQRQLAALLEAVHQAQQVARLLCNSRDNDTEVKLLYGRLEAVRLEVEQLRRGSGMGPFQQIDPKWTGLIPWPMVSGR